MLLSSPRCWSSASSANERDDSNAHANTSLGPRTGVSPTADVGGARGADAPGLHRRRCPTTGAQSASACPRSSRGTGGRHRLTRRRRRNGGPCCVGCPRRLPVGLDQVPRALGPSSASGPRVLVPTRPLLYGGRVQISFAVIAPGAGLCQLGQSRGHVLLHRLFSAPATAVRGPSKAAAAPEAVWLVGRARGNRAASSTR